MSAGTEVVPSSVEGPDGVAPIDRHRAQLGRAARAAGNAAAVIDPVHCAEIRRDMERHRALPAWRRWLVGLELWPL